MNARQVLPPLRASLNKHIAIFVPSYFDFVRLRNHFKKDEISFSNISEYAEGNASREVLVLG
jgi:U3 small nucleolar RNA-associated protein 25